MSYRDNAADAFIFTLCVSPFVLIAALLVFAATAEPVAQKDPTVTVNDYLRTVEHDGHWFVGPRNSGGLLHHPDCPCGKAEEEK